MSREADFRLDTRMREVIAQLEQNRRYYSEDDPKNQTLAHFADASLQALKRQAFREQLEDVLDIRRDLTASHAVKLLERTYQADLLNHDPCYPRGYQNANVWLERFEEIESDPARSEFVTLNLYIRDVQSNIAERYKAIKLIALAYGERFGDAPSHLDVGASVMLGSKKLAFNDAATNTVPFGNISVETVQNELEYRAAVYGELTPGRDPYLTELANKALAQTVTFGDMAGVDITNVDDPAIKRWTKSCSFYPDELFDRARVKEHDVLDQLDPNHERVQFARCDFSKPEDIKKLREIAPEDGYHMITFSTVFYQIPDPQEQYAMLMHAASLLADGGVIIIQDAKDGNFSKRYNYTTSIMDSADADRGEQEILRWKTPRCDEALIGEGRLAIDGKAPRRFDKILEDKIHEVLSVKRAQSDPDSTSFSTTVSE